MSRGRHHELLIFIAHAYLDFKNNKIASENYSKSGWVRFNLILVFEMESSRNFKCEVCEKMFIQSGDLKNHIKTIHEGQRNYKCDACGKYFTASGSRNAHIKIQHEGKSNHKCDSCGKSFNESGSLKTHIKTIHEGQRNHKCDSCGKSFTTSGYLKRHIMTIHEGQKITTMNIVENPSLNQEL